MNDLILDQFLNFLLVEKGLSSNTLEAYSRDLIYYFRFLEARGITDLSQTHPETLYEYLGSLKTRKLSSRTQARTLSAIKSFYRFMQEESLRKDNPALPLQGPKPKRSLPKTLSEMEVETLLHQPKPGSPRGLRDIALLEVLYATGLRVSELISLTLDQLELEAHLLCTMGKGSKERLVPIGKTASSHLPRIPPKRPESPAQGPTCALGLCEQSGGAIIPAGILEDPPRLRPPGGYHQKNFSSYSETYLCHPSVGGRS